VTPQARARPKKTPPAFTRAGGGHHLLGTHEEDIMNSRSIALSFGFFGLLATLAGCSPSSRERPAASAAQAPHPVIDFAMAGKAAQPQPQPWAARTDRFDAKDNPILDARHGWSPASPR
jgi:hypothetical protein